MRRFFVRHCYKFCGVFLCDVKDFCEIFVIILDIRGNNKKIKKRIVELSWDYFVFDEHKHFKVKFHLCQFEKVRLIQFYLYCVVLFFYVFSNINFARCIISFMCTVWNAYSFFRFWKLITQCKKLEIKVKLRISERAHIDGVKTIFGNFNSKVAKCTQQITVKWKWSYLSKPNQLEWS